MIKPLKLVGIIPTRDRPEDLQRLIQSISFLEIQKNAEFRLVIIDNSKHQSALKVLKVLKKSNFPFTHDYIHEPKPGLSRARNAAISHLRSGEYACTIDDDIILPTDYLLRVIGAIKKHPSAGVLGGRVELFDSRDFPETIKTSTKCSTFNGTNGAFGFIHGCNMVIPSATFKKVGVFDQKLGAGSKCRSAEDTDFYFRAWIKGLSVVYEPDLYVFHNHGRREIKDIKKLWQNYRIGQGAFYTKHIIRGNVSAMKLFYWNLSADFKRKSDKSGRLSAWKDRMEGGVHYLSQVLIPS
ncbi:glycosyltransferase family 2 protein [Halochromatium glycolicum]|uniref:Glycosyltransferase 2-like domain-containing protein n=1 Tax=Halochromatium glycolicum TaxID=85075 RepID=A0AAJ0UA15_9GAMM|nr:glycosyltransferase [Halochromatium glycolicum]MBK1707275.1 hypothetical protein [Halochromatium glycolicum]